MELRQRKIIRLNNYDYRRNGAYFITICTHKKEMFLWKSTVGTRIARPQNDIMNFANCTPFYNCMNFANCTPLSNIGKIIDTTINKIHDKYPTIEVDKYVIMVNHIHQILIMHYGDGRAMRAPTIMMAFNKIQERD